MKKSVLLFILAAAGIAAAALFLFVLRPGKAPSQRVLGMWKDLGIEKPNVILVTLDTTRADHLACYGYSGVKTPTLDALAGRGVLFEQCAASSPFTLPSHSTIMTGMYPTYHGVRINGNTALGEEQTTLAEVLAGRGYQCGAFIGAFVLDGRWGLKQGFQHYDDAFDLKKYKHLDLGMVQRPGNEVTDAALAWLDGRKDKPFFAWVHFYDPHSPYHPPEPFASEYPKSPVGQYDGEIAFMDSQIGRLESWLETNGLVKNTVVVLIGDHGEGLGSHGEGTHGYFIYDYAVHVPFLIVTPLEGLKGVRVSSQVRTADVFPTVLDLVGAGASPRVNGRSVVPLMLDPDAGDLGPAYSESMAPNLHYGWAPLRALRTASFKFIDAPRPELYDLTRDRAEATDVQARYPDRALAMKKELDRLVFETSQGAPVPQAANLDKETVERLAALGYIGAPVAPKKAGGKGTGALADPKDKLVIYESIQRAGEMILQDRHDRAAELLEKTLKQEPGIPHALVLLATCYSVLGRTQDAKIRLDEVLQEDPENAQALLALANILTGEGKGEDAIALCKRALAMDGRNNQAYALIAEAYINGANPAGALPYIEKAVEIQPKLTQNRLTLAACLVGTKQYDRAGSMLRDIVRESPNFPFAHFNLGILCEEQEKWDEAREAYAAEAALFPGEYRSRFNLGKLLLRLGDHRGYMDQMRDVVRIAPLQAEGHLFLARGLLSENAPLEGIREMAEKGLSLAKSADLKTVGWLILADVYSRERRPEKMNEALQKASSYKTIK
jgi:arylsulfatase A-like enzyme/tetratricopeptide (TPR) repeat protein